MRKRIDDDCNDGVGGNYNDGVGVGMRRHKRRVKGSVCSFPPHRINSTMGKRINRVGQKWANPLTR